MKTGSLVHDFLYPLEEWIPQQSTYTGTINISKDEQFILKKIAFHLNSKSYNTILSCCFKIEDWGRQKIITQGKFHFVKTAYIEIDFPDYELLRGSVLGLELTNKNKARIKVETILSGMKKGA